jgi:flagellar basal body rod protein FlgC
MNDFDILTTAAGGMEAQRGALDVAARNVALAQTADPTHPVRRLAPSFATAAPPDEADGAAFAALVRGAGDDDDSGAAEDGPGPMFGDGPDSAPVVRFAGAVPGAGSVDSLTEMVGALDAQRAYESNATIFELGKRLAERTIDIGKT